MPRKRTPKVRHELAPALEQPEAGERRTLIQNVEAMEWCEQRLTRYCMHPREAAALARKPPPEGLGMSRNTANRFVSAALQRIYNDQQIEPLEAKRSRLEREVQAQIGVASNRVRHYVTKHGEVKSYPDPDPRTALFGLDLLARIQLHV